MEKMTVDLSGLNVARLHVLRNALVEAAKACGKRKDLERVPFRKAQFEDEETTLLGVLEQVDACLDTAEYKEGYR